MTTNATYPLKNVSSQYGAPMGRRDTMPEDPQSPIRLSLVRLSWVDYDYDQGGAYWGGRHGGAYIPRRRRRRKRCSGVVCASEKPRSCKILDPSKTARGVVPQVAAPPATPARRNVGGGDGCGVDVMPRSEETITEK